MIILINHNKLVINKIEIIEFIYIYLLSAKIKNEFILYYKNSIKLNYSLLIPTLLVPYFGFHITYNI